MTSVTPRLLFETAMEMWGRNEQLDVLVEECCELAHAVLRFKRSERLQIKGAPTMTPEELDKWHLDCIKDVVNEAGDVLVMLGQLPILIPGDYDGVYEQKLKNLFQILQDWGATFE